MPGQSTTMPAFYPPSDAPPTSTLFVYQAKMNFLKTKEIGVRGEFGDVSLDDDQLYKPLMALDRHVQGITDLVFDNNDNNNNDTARELDAAKNALGAVQ